MMNLQEQIRAMAVEGVPQFEICKRLGVGRGKVQDIRRRLGLTGTQPGIAVPELDEKKCRRLLEQGLSWREVALRLHCSESSVRTFDEKHDIPRPERVPADVRERVLDALRRRTDYASAIAHRYGVSYKFVLREAHAMYGSSKFLGSRTKPPFVSHYPQQDQKYRAAAEAKPRRKRAR